MTLSEFKELYSVFTTRNGYPQWLRNKPGAENKLRKHLHSESFAVTRDECYDLPARLPPVLIPVPLEESSSYYDAMAEEMVAMLEGGEFSWAKIPLVQRLRLAQITSGIVKTEPSDNHPEGRLVRVGKEKLKYLEDILYDQFEAEEKVVVGARFRGDISAIVALGKKMKVPVWELHGGIKPADRATNIAEFNRYKGPGMFLAQPDAGSLGIDLSSAATLIWFSLTQSWVNFTQFEDRIALSNKATRYIYLLAEGTIDEIEYEAKLEDGDVARRITESPYRLLRNFKESR
jgi:SNF2 family DNA or RNA helicase